MSMIEISNLTFAYDGSYDNIFENVSLRLDTDWRLGLVGRNGRGKTTLLRLLQHKYEYRGTIRADVPFDYFPFSIPDPDKDAIGVIEDVQPDYEYWQLAREMHRLEMSDEILYRPFRSLSGGEQVKLLLALLFARENRFLLIDEPTNHLDAEARALVADYLKTKRGFLLVSHDRTFCDKIATETVRL